MRIAAAYYRVSTEIQDLERQKSKVREFAKQSDYTIIKEFEDKKSGKTPDRESFQKLQEWIRENPGTSILAAELDRISRGLEGYVQIKAVCRQFNVELKCLNVSKTGNVASDTMLEGILASFAEYDRINVLNRFMSGRLSKLRSGIPIMGRAALGYRCINKTEKSNTMIVVDPIEAKLVNDIFDMFVNQDMGKRTIARLLTEKKIKTKQGKDTWNWSIINRILKNKAYIGELNFREANETIKLSCPPIVDETLFEKCQYKLKHNTRIPHNLKAEYLLTGILKCGVCGANFSGANNTVGKGAYRCGSRSNINKDGTYRKCTSPTVTTKIDDLIWTNVHVIMAKETLSSVPSEDHSKKSIDHINKRIEKVMAVINDIKPKLEKAADAYIEGAIDNENYKRIKEKYEKMEQECLLEIKSFERQRSELEQGLTSRSTYDRVRQMLERTAMLQSLTFKEKKELVNEVIEKIVVLPELYHYEIYYKLPYRFSAKMDATKQLIRSYSQSILNIYNSPFGKKRFGKYLTKKPKRLESP